jgi:hypothetical protein
MDEKTMKKISEMAKRRRKKESKFWYFIAWTAAIISGIFGC